MFVTRIKTAVTMLLLLALVGSGAALVVHQSGAALVHQAWAVQTPDRSEPPAVVVRLTAGIPADQFDKLRALIKPKPGGFDDISWMTDLWEARKKAAAEGKPLLVWVGDGHPLGWT